MKSFRLILTLFIFLSFNAYSQEYAKNPVKRTKKAPETSTPIPKKEVTDATVKNPVTTTTVNEADFEALMKKGIALSQEEKNEEAIKIFTQALALSNEENAYRALFGRGSIYFREKEYSKARADYTTLINDTKLPHDNAKGNAYNMRSLANKLLGNDKEACADHKMARELGAVSGEPIPGFNCN